MSFFDTLLTWADLPFTTAMATVLTFAALQASGVLGLVAGGESDHDADAGGDAHADVDADASGDHDVDHDVDHDTDHEGERGSTRGDSAQAATGLLATVGIGRLPTSIVWQTFAMSFGMVGALTNGVIWMTTQRLEPAALIISMPVALVGGYALTAGLVKAMMKLIKPPREASGRRDLVGLPGVVVSGQVDDQFGEVRVKLSGGDFVQVPCRVMSGEKSIGHHESIVIIKYDRADDRIYVAPVSTETNESPSRSISLRS